MGRSLVLACALLGHGAAGCNDELVGASPYSEVGPADTGAADARPRDAGPPPGLNDIDGYYVDEAIPRTRAIYRLDRASDPGRPRLIIVSTNDAVTLPCDTFKRADWNTTLPAGAMIHAVDLGAASAGAFTVRRDTPPAADGAAIGRTFTSAGPLSLERATKGRVTITSTDVTGARGLLEAIFEVYYEDGPLPSENKIIASFNAPACAVD